jgi:dUTP pyrophosphatase
MNRIAKFEKVSIGQFTAAWKDTFQEQSEEKICEIYGALKLPQRATAGSAGYDFFAPVDLVLAPGETIKIPTGAGLGTEMLSEKRSWIQVQITVEQYRRNY